MDTFGLGDNPYRPYHDLADLGMFEERLLGTWVPQTQQAQQASSLTGKRKRRKKTMKTTEINAPTQTEADMTGGNNNRWTFEGQAVLATSWISVSKDATVGKNIILNFVCSNF